MEEIQSVPSEKITKSFVSPDNPKKLLLSVVIASVVLGTITGYVLAQNGSSGPLTSAGLPGTQAKNAASDSRTFRDFAEGTIKAKPQAANGAYTEGTHSLVREVEEPVALTSSVVDLSIYEGKKVKVFGETQKALKEGWLMDVGKVEEVQ